MPNKPKKFTHDSVVGFCQENEITLTSPIPELETSILNEYIEGKCKTCVSGSFHSKIYQFITKHRYYCADCAKITQQEKSKETLMKNHGVDHPMKLQSIKDKIKQTCMDQYGVDNPAKTEKCKEKAKQTNLTKRGVEWSLQDPEVRKKAKETLWDKFGVEFASQNKDVQLKTRETTLGRFGYEHASQHPDNRSKVEATNMERFGYKYASQNPDIREKVKATCMERLGVENPMQNKEIQMRAFQTNLRKYNVMHPMQNASIAEKARQYKQYDYTFPSGNVIHLQGYEPFAVDILLQTNLVETDLITSKEKVPPIWYNNTEGTERRYYVDIYIPSRNLFVEVKSIWTFQLHHEKIMASGQAVIDAGYEFQCWILNKKGELLEIL